MASSTIQCCSMYNFIWTSLTCCHSRISTVCFRKYSATICAATSRPVPWEMCALRRFRSRGYKTFFVFNSVEHEICPANNVQITYNCNFFLLNIAEHENFSANKYENANKVGIFIFIGRENFMLSWVAHEKRFVTSMPGQHPQSHWVAKDAKFLQKMTCMSLQLTVRSWNIDSVYVCIHANEQINYCLNQSFFMRTRKTLIRLCGCVVQRYLFSRWDSCVSGSSSS